MADATVSFDHVHLVSEDAHATAAWYAEKLGGEIFRRLDLRGAPQVYVSLGGFIIIVRGQRTAESAAAKPGLQWGVDHFGLRVKGDFDGFCAGLREKGVRFSMEPTDFNETTRIAFIEAPDGVSVELLNRKDMQ
ncbi:MAG TPA: VOC family protein [Burkholderiales bacterium]|jgi:lactoylglutathione lyase|nr:VOC family protein [Burkholderiales bacterium]